MTLDLDNMTQAEFDEVMAEIKAKRPNLFQFIADFVDRKVSTEEVDEYLKMKHEKQVEFINPNHSYLSQLDVTYKTPDLMSHFLPPHEVSFTFCCSSIVFPR
ncbi:putative glutamine transport system permease protein [Streptococcus pneumoniae]|nr:putative glutamine transport system permease protein [Streptococcus pneumoniae]